VVLGVAYLTKEPAVFVALALLIDSALGRRWRQAVGVALGIGAVVAIEHAYYVGTTGDPLFRLHTLSRAPGITVAAASQVKGIEHVPPAVATAPSEGAPPPPASTSVQDDDVADEERLVSNRLVRRAFITYPQNMIEPNEDFGIHSLAALIVAAAAFLRFRHDWRARLLLLWAAVPWLYTNFGTTSFSRYLLMPPAPRYIDLVYPPLFLFGGWLFADWLSRPDWSRRLFLATIAVVSLVGVATGLSTRATEYRTADVAVLRVIAANAAEKRLGRVCVGIDPAIQSRLHWQRALFILSGGNLQECDGGSSDLFLSADPIGVPYVVSRQK
jgi:hypothetical protein